jgi:hypothetical protein
MNILKRYGCFLISGFLINALFDYSIYDYETWVFVISVTVSYEFRLEQLIKDKK